MEARSFARHITLLVMVLALVIAAAPAAFAQPSNDDFDNPTTVDSLPFQDTVDTSDATSADDDPEPSCVGTSSTVWYAFTPSETQFVQADTFGSDFDTTLSVWTGARGALDQVACNDDFEDLQSRVNFEATAGTTYYFMVGSFDQEPGGNLVFSVDVGSPPVGIEAFDVDETGSVTPKTGEGTIRGTVTCTNPGTVFIDGFASQRKGRVFIQGFFFTQVECSGETRWSAPLIGENGLFTGGKVDVEAFAFAEDEGGFAQDFTTVRLRGKR